MARRRLPRVTAKVNEAGNAVFACEVGGRVCYFGHAMQRLRMQQNGTLGLSLGGLGTSRVSLRMQTRRGLQGLSILFAVE